MSPSRDFAPSWSMVGRFRSAAGAVFGELCQTGDSLARLNARTLADIGIAHVGQGRDSVHVAMTDTGRQDVKRSVTGRHRT